MARASSYKYRRQTVLAAIVLLASCVLVPGCARAADVEVKILTTGNAGMFDPEIVHVKPGDNVHFVAVGKGHNVQSIKSMIPEDAPSFRGPISSDFVVTMDKPGIYGYYCMPHFFMGMVGLIVVGKPMNEDAVKAGMNAGVPDKAKAKFTQLFNTLDRIKNAN